MSWQINTPGQSGSTNKNTNQTTREQLFNHGTILPQHTSMMNTEAIRKQLSQLLVPWSHHLWIGPKLRLLSGIPLVLELFWMSVGYRMIKVFSPNSWEKTVKLYHVVHKNLNHCNFSLELDATDTLKPKHKSHSMQSFNSSVSLDFEKPSLKKKKHASLHSTSLRTTFEA